MERWPAVDARTAILPSSIGAAARSIATGGVVAIPTETYYGLAADPGRADALDRVRRLKGRAEDKPLLLLVDGVARARRVAPGAPSLLERLAGAFWPGPLTLVLPAPAGLHPALVGPGGGVAIRHPAHPVAEALVGRCDRPLTGTSANRSGDPAADRPDAIRLHRQSRLLAGILDAGPTPGGPPSTLLDLTGERPRVLRPGAVEAERLREVLDLDA